MRRFLAAIVISLFAYPAFAQTGATSVVFRDSVISTGIRTDTVYSPTFPLAGYRYITFGTRVKSLDTTGFANDTLTVKLQSSFDGSVWTTHGTTIQQIVGIPSDTVVNSTVIVDADASFLASLGRFMYIYTDSTTYVGGGLDNNVYRKKIVNYYARF